MNPPLLESLDEAREQVLYGLGHCQILKISDNEIQWLTGEEDYTDGVNWIRDRYEIPLILVSMGKEGSRAYYNEMLTFANAAASIITTRKGALRVMPEEKEIKLLI